MKTKPEDVIHFYLGCDVQTKIRVETGPGIPMKKLKGKLISFDIIIPDKIDVLLENEKHPLNTTSLYISDIKLMLRSLSSMTLVEMAELNWSENDELKHAIGQTNRSLYMSEFLYLINRKFDLFGLIESKHAISL